VTLDELLADREKLSTRLREIIDSATEPWGVKVTAMELLKAFEKFASKKD